MTSRIKCDISVAMSPSTPVNPVNQKVDILGAELESVNESLSDFLGLEKGIIMKQSHL